MKIETFYIRYGPMVLRRCQCLLGDEGWAVDAMHDVFVQLLRHQNKLNDDAPSSLLYRTLVVSCGGDTTAGKKINNINDRQ